MISKDKNQGLNSEYDVMIIGSGPAGISTWLYLNKYRPKLAEKAVIIEKDIHPRKKLCGGALQNHFVDKVFNDLKIHLSIPRVDIHKVNVKYGSEGFAFEKKSFLSIIDRSVFDSHLVDVAKSRGAVVLENESFIDINEKRKMIEVQTSKGKYQLKFLIGADGALSKIRKKITSPYKISYASTLEVFAPVNPHFDSEFDDNAVVMDWSCIKNDIEGYVWHFPCVVDGKPSMNHGICNSRINPSNPAGDLKKIFKEALIERGLDIPMSSWKSHPVSYFIGEKYLSNSNILLVGDAAGIEPLIGGGIHLALMYGDVAAKTIISAFDADDFSLIKYTENVNNHIVGRYINNSIEIAKQIYSGKADLLETIKKNLEMIAKN
jgi:flavin-dependent dehydrogenase